ncbi:pseudouridine synthase [Robbsia betulipollinis]
MTRPFSANRPASSDRSPRQEKGRPPAGPSHDARTPATAAVPTVAATPREDDGTLRLSKRMSELGLCSRREADEWIEKGWVRVDGERVDTLGIRVRPEQHVEVIRQAREQQNRLVTILLHKPVGHVSGQPEDGHPPAAALILPDNRWILDASRHRFEHVHLRALAPAGRLDIDSTGLLVFTQDGRIAKRLIGEASEVEKEYLVRVTYGTHQENVQAHFPADKLALLRHGLSLEDVALRPAEVDWQNGEQLRFVLHEGKKRQIRRMCELVGLEVVGLKRVRIGEVMLGSLPVGEWRYLAENEVF